MSKHVDAHERQVRTLSVLLAFKAGASRLRVCALTSLFTTYAGMPTFAVPPPPL